MCDRRLLLPALLVALAGASLGAQQDVAALQTRRVALQARGDSLKSVVDSLRRVEADSGLTVVASFGSLRMRTTKTLQPVAAPALGQAVRDAKAAIGPEAGVVIARMTLTLRENRSAVRYNFIPSAGATISRAGDRITSASLEARLDGREVPGVTLVWPVTQDDLADAVLGLLERAVADGLPTALSRWAGQRVPLRNDPPEYWRDMYRMLATAEASVVRRCVAGDRAACRLGFALDSMPANRVAAWYDNSDLPGRARTAGDPMQRSWMFRSIGTDEQEECTARGRLDTCRQMIAFLPVDAFRVPMPDAARGALTRIALEAGGTDALARLRAAGETNIAAQLSAAARISADSLVGLWQRRVIAARPESPVPSATFVLASLACIAVCGFWAARGQPWQ